MPSKPPVAPPVVDSSVPDFATIEHLIVLMMDLYEHVFRGYRLRLGDKFAADMDLALQKFCHTTNMYSVGSFEDLEVLYTTLDDMNTETMPLIEFVITLTQQLYMHFPGPKQVYPIEQILAQGIGALECNDGDTSLMAMPTDTYETLPWREDVQKLLTANRWFCVLLLISMRPLREEELVEETPKA
jgi:hypothetical protein